MVSYTNGGSMTYHQSGQLRILPDLKVYYNLNSLANLLSMGYVTDHYRVTMDSAMDGAIVIHTEKSRLKFVKCGHGLYYHDTNYNHNDTGYSFLSSVAHNKLYYTRREVQSADDARLLQGRIGWPQRSMILLTSLI